MPTPQENAPLGQPPCKTIGLFGGAFNPPHVGHVLAVQYVLLTAPLDRVLVVPSAEHPFGKRVAPFEDRLAMTRLAFQPLGNRVEVLDIEARREGPSYTIDTVEELHRSHPGVCFEVIIGSDNLAQIDAWRRIENLRRLARFRVLPRLGDGESPAEKDAVFALPAVSSTRLRRALAERDFGLAGRMTPRGVLEYIQQKHLYLDE